MTYLAQVSIGYDSGLPEDVTVNTFHFDDNGVAPLGIANLTQSLFDFYDVTPPGAAGPIRSMLSVLLDPATWTVKIYDLDEPKPRVPIFEVTQALTGVGTGSLPEEVAVCMSFQAEPQSGVAQARRRNRIYLGPLHSGAAIQSGSRMVPSTSFQTTIAQAAVQLGLDSSAAADWTWVVYSPTSGLSAPVNDGWVDNSLDTQRRRGPKPTSRQTFNILA